MDSKSLICMSSGGAQLIGWFCDAVSYMIYVFISHFASFQDLTQNFTK